MIERFNFYDIYGYLIPGVILIIIVTLPFVIVDPTVTTHLEINGELLSLIFGIAISYVTGYFLHSMATDAIPSAFGGQYPSVWLLNASDKTFSPEFKQKIAAKAKQPFGLEVDVARDSDENLGRIRQNVFFATRPKVSSKTSGSYSEQFQGLYSMMRGLSIDFFFGTLYMLGWTASPWKTPCTIDVAVGLILLSAVSLIALSIVRCFQRIDDPSKKSLNRSCLGAIALTFLCSGYLVGKDSASTYLMLTLGIMALFYLGASARFYASYKLFSVTFAKSVWEGFVAA